MSTILVTGADRGLGLGISKELLKRGHRVFAGQFMPDWKELDELKVQYPDTLEIIPLDVSSTDSIEKAADLVTAKSSSLDVLISNAGISCQNFGTIREGVPCDDDFIRTYLVNSVAVLKLVHFLLPLLDKGTDKKICVVSSEAGRIGQGPRTDMYAYCMSKSAVNMAVKNMFNCLRPDGYKFRLYHPGWIRSYMRGYKSTVGNIEPDEAGIYAVKHFIDEEMDDDTLQLVSYDGVRFPW